MKSCISINNLLIAIMACLPAVLAGCSKKSDEAPALQTEDVSMSSLAPAGAQASMSGAYSEDTVIVEVNGNKLTYGEASRVLDAQLASMGNHIPPEQYPAIRDQLFRNIVENFVGKTLFLEEAGELDIQVSEEEKQEALDEMAENLPEGKTMEQVIAESAMGEEAMRKELSDALTINKVLEHHIEKMKPITDEEIAEFSEENAARLSMPDRREARHILIAFEDGDDEETKAAKKKAAEEVRAKLLDGADFAEVAAEYSDCPSAKSGGSLGVFPKGRMVKPFEDAAFSLETNEISEVVETRFGYHVIEVTDIQEAGSADAEQVKELMQRMREKEVVQERMRELRQDAEIKYGEEFSNIAQ